MKGLLILCVVVAGGVWAAYHFGGFADLDPATQAEQLTQQVRDGMTWEQVADIREPRRYYSYDAEAQFNPWREARFDRKAFNDMAAAGGLPSEFKFRYAFSESLVYEVLFAGGRVIGVEKARTAADLFTLPGSQ